MTNNECEYGPWIEHDGLGCPCVGSFVHLIEHYATHDSCKDVWIIAGSAGGLSWDWSNAPRYTRVIRYRIRKPKAMQMLREILREVTDNPKIMEPV